VVSTHKELEPTTRNFHSLAFAIIVSLAVTRCFAGLLSFRVRPMFAPGVGYDASSVRGDLYTQNWSAFPSDAAAIEFATPGQ
jgi:hypothetical protein